MVSGVYFAIRWAVNVMKKKFVTYVDAELVAALSAIATREGRRISAVEEHAVRGLLAAEQFGDARGRNHVVRAYLRSTRSYSSLYKALAR